MYGGPRPDSPGHDPEVLVARNATLSIPTPTGTRRASGPTVQLAVASGSQTSEGTCHHRGRLRHAGPIPAGPAPHPESPVSDSPPIPSPAAEADRLWTSAEAAEYLNVSERWLADAPVPRLLLPNTRHNQGAKRRRRIARYEPARVRQWVLDNLTTDKPPRKEPKATGRRGKTGSAARKVA